jgi:hypothetical protein
MKAILHLLIIAFSVLACNNSTHNLQQELAYQMPTELKNNYNIFSKRKSVVGALHYRACFEKDNEALRYLRDSSSKSDLLWMLSDTNEKAFKLFLIEEIHRKHPELDSMLISQYGEDTTIINFNSSCMGVVFQKEFGETCTNIIKLNAFDKLIVPVIYESE